MCIDLVCKHALAAPTRIPPPNARSPDLVWVELVGLGGPRVADLRNVLLDDGLLDGLLDDRLDQFCTWFAGAKGGKTDETGWEGAKGEACVRDNTLVAKSATERAN